MNGSLCDARWRKTRPPSKLPDGPTTSGRFLAIKATGGSLKGVKVER